MLRAGRGLAALWRYVCWAWSDLSASVGHWDKEAAFMITTLLYPRKLFPWLKGFPWSLSDCAGDHLSRGALMPLLISMQNEMTDW